MTDQSKDPAAELIADLSVLYGWAVSNTEALLLRAAFTGRTRLEIADVSARTAGPAKALTVADLLAALRTTTAPAQASAPGIPYHLPTCHCGGSGDITGENRPDKHRVYRTLARCQANSGRPITADQYERWQQDQKIQAMAAAGEIPPKVNRFNEVRAALHRVTEDSK